MPRADLTAATTGKTELWESTLLTFVNSFTGPTAFAIGIVGFISAGAALLWGGELGGFVKRMVQVILCLGIILFAASVAVILFPSLSGALVR